MTQSGGNEGLGFALPSGIIAVAYPQLRKFGHFHRGEIGISVQTITPSLAAGLGLGIDPEKDLVSKLGILGIEIDKKISQMLPGLREASGVIVAAKAAGFGVEENSLAIGDVIHALNGTPVIGLDFLRSALDRIKPDAPVALQVERDGRMMYTTFRME